MEKKEIPRYFFNQSCAKEDNLEPKKSEYRRFEPLTDEPEDLKALEQLIKEKGLTRQDIALILFSIRVRPGFQRSDFGI